MRVFLLAVLLLFAGDGFSADQIGILHLVNGDRVTGRILSRSSSNLVVQTDWNPSLPIPHRLIARTEILGAPIIVSPKKATPSPVKPTPPVPSPVEVAKAVAPKSTKSKIVAKPKVKSVWTHDLRLGLDLQYSAIERQIFHSRLRSTHTRGPFRNLLDLNYSYGKSDRVVSADKFTGSLKTDYTPKDRWYVYHIGSVGYDLARRIEFRYQIGPGAGYHVIKGKPFLIKGSKLTLNLESGGEFEDKRATSGISTQKYFWRLAENVTWRINENLTLSEELEFFPQIGELVNHRYRFESNLAYKLLRNLTLNFTVLAEADPENLSDFEPESLQVQSSLGFKF
ncbi:MAG: DUF481 domain-containing protein [Verrucomicrobiia bacterium]|jgi:putative salt-induced outer membrane protein YdiY